MRPAAARRPHVLVLLPALAVALAAAACAGPRAAGDPAERARAALLAEARQGLASLDALASGLPREIEALRARSDAGEVGEALLRASMGLVHRCSAIAEDAEGVVEPLRDLPAPPPALPELEEESLRVATSARQAALQALELADAVSARICRPPEPGEGLFGPAGGAGPPEVEHLLEPAADAAAAGLAHSLSARKLERIVVVPVAVRLVPAASPSGSVAIYGRQFSRRLAASLREVHHLPASFASQCACGLEGSRQAQPALVSGTLVLQPSGATYSLSVAGADGRARPASVTGTLRAGPPGAW